MLTSAMLLQWIVGALLLQVRAPGGRFVLDPGPCSAVFIAVLPLKPQHFCVFGQVTYLQTPDFDPEPGNCLLYVSMPHTDVTLEA